MGKRADRQSAARVLWAAEKMMSDAASLISGTNGDYSLRNAVLDKANEVRLLAGDVYQNRLPDID